jgi:hypothetical protein
MPNGATPFRDRSTIDWCAANRVIPEPTTPSASAPCSPSSARARFPPSIARNLGVVVVTLRHDLCGAYRLEKIAFEMRTPTCRRRKAADMGSACAEVIGGLLEVRALFRLRAAQGVLV